MSVVGVSGWGVGDHDGLARALERQTPVGAIDAALRKIDQRVDQNHMVNKEGLRHVLQRALVGGLQRMQDDLP
eukprot:11214537-Lingulodinium_polyedra.AAC.1